MDIVSKKDILELDSPSEQRTQLFAVKQSANTIRNSDPPLRGWVCHVCTHFNAPGTLASPDGPCQTCLSPACDVACADATVTKRNDSRCSGYACWYCKYFWAWPEDEDGEKVRDGDLTCTVCGDLEEEEVVFLKSWFEDLDGVNEQAEEQHEQAKKKDEGKKEDEKAEMDDIDDGGGTFIKANRKRARPKKKDRGEGTL